MTDELEQPGEEALAAETTEEPAETAAPQGEDLGKVPAYQGEPYTFEGCTITFSMAWLPLAESEDPQTRKVLLGIRTHQDTPLALRLLTAAELAAGDAPLGNLPNVVTGLLEKVRQELPKRAILAAKGKRQPKATITIENKTPASAPVTAATEAQPASTPAKNTAGQMGLFDLFNNGG